MAVIGLRRFAAAAPVPVFVAVGEGAAERAETLSLMPDIECVASPRHAGILLVAGDLTDTDHEPLRRVHDQMPSPRATLWWGTEPPDGFPSSAAVPAEASPRDALIALHRERIETDFVSEPVLLPDEPPAPWRGLGDHGQGGEGMMGGTPYGRMMPMPPQPDVRDGLALDEYTAEYGPFLPGLPPGLIIEVTLQGDVVQTARIRRPPYRPSAVLRRPFEEARAGNPAVVAMERTRAAHHLCCVARVASLLDLVPWAERCRLAAQRIERGEPVDLGRLRRQLRRTGMFAAISPGLGRTPPGIADALGGVAARAAGHSGDVRAGHAVYGGGFRPVVQAGGDVAARVAQWLAEAEQSVELIDVLPDGTDLSGEASVEGPWGVLGAHAAETPVAFAVTDLLVGLEWGEALLVIASFDVEALRRMTPKEEDHSPMPGEEGRGA